MFEVKLWIGIELNHSIVDNLKRHIKIPKLTQTLLKPYILSESLSKKNELLANESKAYPEDKGKNLNDFYPNFIKTLNYFQEIQ